MHKCNCLLNCFDLKSEFGPTFSSPAFSVNPCVAWLTVLSF